MKEGVVSCRLRSVDQSVRVWLVGWKVIVFPFEITIQNTDDKRLIFRNLSTAHSRWEDHNRLHARSLGVKPKTVATIICFYWTFYILWL